MTEVIKITNCVAINSEHMEKQAQLIKEAIQVLLENKISLPDNLSQWVREMEYIAEYNARKSVNLTNNDIEDSK